MREAVLETLTESVGIDALNADRQRIGAMAHVGWVTVRTESANTDQ